MELVVVYD